MSRVSDLELARGVEAALVDPVGAYTRHLATCDACGGGTQLGRSVTFHRDCEEGLVLLRKLPARVWSETLPGKGAG